MKRLFFPVFALLVHCGGSGGGSEGSSSAAPSPSDTSSEAGAVPGADGGCGTTDDPDDKALDDNCDGADGIVGKDVYVSIDSGADTNAGTPQAPLRTLGAALALATSRQGHVLALEGSYPMESLSVAGTWSVYGGYPQGFRTPLNRALTTLTVPSKGLLVDQAGSALIAHITVEGASADDPKQPSAHALRSKVAKARSRRCGSARR
jgi:hypothetical protein